MRLSIILAMAACAAWPAIASAQTTVATPFSAATKVSTDTLGSVTGRADLSQVIRASNSSTVSNNSVTGNSVTGTITFNDGAFQNLNGLSLLSANTGNNVAINSSLNVNVTVTP